jgi:hypothetical protein
VVAVEEKFSIQAQAFSQHLVQRLKSESVLEVQRRRPVQILRKEMMALLHRMAQLQHAVVVEAVPEDH